MKNRIQGTLAAVLLALTAAGCSNVYTTQPVGESPASLNAEDWDGQWFKEDGALTIKVMDEEKGILKVAWIEPEDDDLKLESMDLYLLKAGEWMFANHRDNKDPAKPRWMWGRIELSGKRLIVWLPEVERFTPLITSGRLPGLVEGSDVFLGDLKPEHLEIIMSGAEGTLFDWEDPFVLTRFCDQ